MFSLDLTTLKSCILWIFFSLFFPPPHLSPLSLHFHCEFIRVCSLVELFLLAFVHPPHPKHPTTTTTKFKAGASGKITNPFKFTENFRAEALFVLMLYILRLFFFCSFFDTIMSHLRFEIFLFSIQMNNFEIFSAFHTPVRLLCVLIMHETFPFLSRRAARWRVEASRAVERKKFHFVVTRWMCRFVHVYRHLQHCSSPYGVKCGGWEGKLNDMI